MALYWDYLMIHTYGLVLAYFTHILQDYWDNRPNASEATPKNMGEYMI